MPRYRGSTPIVARYRGSVPITARFRGSQPIWSRGGVHFDFTEPNAPLTSYGWVDHGPSSDFKAGVVDGAMRLALPDGLIALTERTSRARYGTPMTKDGGFIEIRVATKGDGTKNFLLGTVAYTTQVFGWVSNAAFTHGVGIGLEASQLSIVRRVAGTDTKMASCGAFGAGDVVRLIRGEVVFTMKRNGQIVGVWPDTGNTAASGVDYRSLGVRVDASKDPLGPRRFSPSIDWLRFG